MTYHHSKHETCIVMDGTCMYNCPTFFLFWKCLDDMSYWTNLYRTVADNELHFFTISNLNYTVFVSLALILALSLTDWSWLLDIICSVALALRVDIVSPEATRRPYQTFICCVCPSVPLSGGRVQRTRLASRSRMPELASLNYCDNC